MRPISACYTSGRGAPHLLGLGRYANRSQRNAVTRVIRQRKRNYYDEKINETQSNPKKLWKVLNQLTGQQQRDEIPGDLNANEFNEYFTSVGSDTVSHSNVSESDTLIWRGSNWPGGLCDSDQIWS